MTGHGTGENREATPMRDVAVVGLGQMGRGIARNLDRGGRLAAAWDSSPEALQRAGLSDAVKLAEPGTADGLRAILFVVPGSAEIRAVLDGGLLSQPHQGQVLIDLTTSHPTATREIAAQAKAAGRDYIDGGMTGGAKAADAGTITLMVGGSPAVVEACRPLLGLIAGKVFHVGETGTGHAMKLIHNMICHTIFLATSEGCRLAESVGIPLETAIAVINAGNAGSFVSEQRFPNHIISRTFDGRSRTANLAKDLAMAADFAREEGQPGPYGALTAGLLARAMQQGLGEKDFTTLYQHFAEITESKAK
ncbi:MAG: NAD(P)-dependent oxidoreductase [Hyphomicrobiaceae bacterium]